MFKKRVMAMGLLISICLEVTACGQNTEVKDDVTVEVEQTVEEDAEATDEGIVVDEWVEVDEIPEVEEVVEDVVVEDTTDILTVEDGVEAAIRGNFDGIFAKGAVSGAAYVILGQETDAETGNVSVYALTSFAEYELEGEELVRYDGTEVVPALITLAEADGVYTVVGYEMLDETGINELVPEDFREAMLDTTNYEQVLADMELVDAESTPIEEVEEVEEEIPMITPEAVTDETILNVFDSVKKELGEDYYPAMPVPAELLEATYGLTPDMYESAYGEIPMINVNIDVFVGVKAAEGMVEQVQDALGNYVEMMKADTMQYPSNLAKIPAMTVVTRGDYVFLVGTFGDTVDVEPEGDDAILKVAQVNVDKTIDMIYRVIPE